MVERTKIGLRDVRSLQLGQTIWDAEVRGFGARRQKSEAVTYFVRYRTDEGRQRVYVIGRHGSPWTPQAARCHARSILYEVAEGKDPASIRRARRKAKTVAELCDQYFAEAETRQTLTRFGTPKKPSTLATDRGRIERHIKPLLGR